MQKGEQIAFSKRVSSQRASQGHFRGNSFDIQTVPLKFRVSLRVFSESQTKPRGSSTFQMRSALLPPAHKSKRESIMIYTSVRARALKQRELTVLSIEVRFTRIPKFFYLFHTLHLPWYAGSLRMWVTSYARVKPTKK